METPPGTPVPESPSNGGPIDANPNGPVPLEAESPRQRWLVPLGIILAALLIFLFGPRPTLRATWQEIASFLIGIQGKPEPASPAVLSEHETQDLDKQLPQKQAELLLQRAINHYQGATDQISARVDDWLGSLKLTPNLNSLITTALNANDLRVRAAAVEIQLAASGVSKNRQSVEALIQRAGQEDEGRAWALWTLGLLGNRGVEPQRVGQVLTDHLNDSEEAVRRWAVEGLAHLGTDETIVVLLKVFHDDPSPVVRERAACSLAQSGMLTQAQRKKAIPELLTFTDDPTLDPTTRVWVFQALRDITGEHFPDDPAGWRNWHATQSD